MLLGGLIAFHSYEVCRRTTAAVLRAPALDLGFETVGALLAGVVDQPVPVGSSVALVMEGIFATVGLATVLDSL